MAEQDINSEEVKHLKSLLVKALEFWSADGIDMPDIDLFDAAVKATGFDGEVANNYKPVGLMWDEFQQREKFVAELILQRKK